MMVIPSKTYHSYSHNPGTFGCLTQLTGTYVMNIDLNNLVASMKATNNSEAEEQAMETKKLDLSALSRVDTVNRLGVTQVDLNNQMVVGTLTTRLVRTGLEPFDAAVIAIALVESYSPIEDNDLHEWREQMHFNLEFSQLSRFDYERGQEVKHYLPDTTTIGIVENHLTAARILDVEGDKVWAGDFLKEICNRMSRVLNVVEELPSKRKFPVAHHHNTVVAEKALKVLESTPITVYEEGITIAKKVMEMRPDDTSLKSQFYVVTNSEGLDPTRSYFSEWKFDGRGRMYQAYASSINGQTSDLARMITDFSDVDMGYNPHSALKSLYEEAGDMVGGKPTRTQLLKLMKEAVNGDAAWLNNELDDLDSKVKKPWSFWKVSVLTLQLKNHIDNGAPKPYIGFHFGLDAKCSGPQIGGLLSGDVKMLMACGFSLKEVNDAYENTQLALEKAGFHGLTRDDVKGVFMASFYGQGWGALCKRPKKEDDKFSMNCFRVIHGDDEVTDVEAAKLFHKTVIASFGSKLLELRRKIQKFGQKYVGKGEVQTLYATSPSFLFPDGFKSQMKYKKEMDIFGNIKGGKVPFKLECGLTSFYFADWAMETEELDLGRESFNAFVNLIQGIDALLARLIISYLGELNVRHVISIHDCFRVDVNSVDKLPDAIKFAYFELFGSPTNEVTNNLPHGMDILRLFFEGHKEALLPEYKPYAEGFNQFWENRQGKVIRRLKMVSGHKLPDLIRNLGKTYFFSK